MATPVAAATEAIAQQIPRRFGNKQIFLPNHVVAFIRPWPKQPPNLATFVVPLQFNKLDLRDYLFHAYNVEVTSVRSFINQPPPERKHGQDGKWYRPRSQKMMIAELVKPFVWPEPPAEADREPFDHKIWKKMQAERQNTIERQSKPREMVLPSWDAKDPARLMLKEQADEFLKSGEWSNGKEKWTEVEKEAKV